MKLGLEEKVVDAQVLEQTVERFREKNILFPTFAQLADPETIPENIKAKLKEIDPLAPHPLNLFRIHWYNSDDGRDFVKVPEHVVLPPELTGVKAKIVVLVGKNFPMVNCHKVLAAFGCLAPRLVTGQFNPQKHRAIWPSTGNYCRGGVAVSRIMDCHGVAILPEGMSAERFSWLREWCLDPEHDIIATEGCESNVKEIYDKCREMEADADNVIFNQFCEFGNALSHYLCTGKAIEKIWEHLYDEKEGFKMRNFVSATGSAGTLSAGDYLKEKFGAQITAVEALECPTLLKNGFGGHNIQGIGDKHLPYVHNAMNTDFVVAVSDKDTDRGTVLFNTPEGKRYLVEHKKMNPEFVDSLSILGLSSICNVLAAIKIAKYCDYDEKDVIFTVATDAAEMYTSETEMAVDRYFDGNFTELKAAEAFGSILGGVGTDNMKELTHTDRETVFNLGYYTWVEQQGVEFEDFVARRSQSYWTGLRHYTQIWDNLIAEFNAATGVKV